jgi:hypothetical protein
MRLRVIARAGTGEIEPPGGERQAGPKYTTKKGKRNWL